MPTPLVGETYIKGVSPPCLGRGRASGAGSDLLRPETDPGTKGTKGTRGTTGTIGRVVPDRARPPPGRPGRAAGRRALAGHRPARRRPRRAGAAGAARLRHQH